MSGVAICTSHTHTYTHTRTHINAMGSQSFTHQCLGFAVVILFPNCPPTYMYKHKTASVILFYICILLEPLLFLTCLVHFYHAHTYTPGKCVVCAYVGCVHVLKSTCSDLCGLGSHAVRELSREMMKRSRANF